MACLNGGKWRATPGFILWVSNRLTFWNTLVSMLFTTDEIVLPPLRLKGGDEKDLSLCRSFQKRGHFVFFFPYWLSESRGLAISPLHVRQKAYSHQRCLNGWTLYKQIRPNALDCVLF